LTSSITVAPCHVPLVIWPHSSIEIRLIHTRFPCKLDGPSPN
jgi:hypothetical protein